VTIGALTTMAAHLEGKGASVLDFTGFAQKFGPVISYVRFGADPAAINQVRVDAGAADALIGGDVVVSSSPKASNTYRTGMRAVLNTAEMPTGDIVLHRDASLRSDARIEKIAEVIGRDNLRTADANRLAEELMGDAIYANMIMLGMAWQRGLVPVTLDALTRAIELNNVAVDANKRALACGRLMAADPSALAAHLNPKPDFATSPEDIIARRAEFLEGYQNRAWADRYRRRMAEFEASMPVENRLELVNAAAKSLFKLMSYKDEYEVARLHDDPAFRKSLTDRFQGDFRIVHHFAPPLLAGGKDARGRPLKTRLRARHPSGAFNARTAQGPARHRVRPLRLHRRAQDGARADRMVRNPDGALRAGNHARDRRNMAPGPVRADGHPRLRPGQTRGGRHGES
jgi:indolepyruvate ferredoxin oxidoreductase